jgi:hypothetical protein
MRSASTDGSYERRAGRARASRWTRREMRASQRFLRQPARWQRRPRSPKGCRQALCACASGCTPGRRFSHARATWATTSTSPLGLRSGGLDLPAREGLVPPAQDDLEHEPPSPAELLRRQGARARGGACARQGRCATRDVDRPRRLRKDAPRNRGCRLARPGLRRRGLLGRARRAAGPGSGPAGDLEIRWCEERARRAHRGARAARPPRQPGAGDRCGVRALGAPRRLSKPALRVGDLRSAESRALAALADLDEGAFNHASGLEILGESARRSGDEARAGDCFRDALRSFAALGDGGGVADCLDGLSRLAAARDTGRAGRLRGAAQQLCEARGRRPIRADVPLPDVPNSALAEGRAMTLEEAVDYALRQ